MRTWPSVGDHCQDREWDPRPPPTDAERSEAPASTGAGAAGSAAAPRAGAASPSEARARRPLPRSGSAGIGNSTGCRMNGWVCGPAQPAVEGDQLLERAALLELGVVEAVDHDVRDVLEAVGPAQVIGRARRERRQRVLALDRDRRPGTGCRAHRARPRPASASGRGGSRCADAGAASSSSFGWRSSISSRCSRRGSSIRYIESEVSRRQHDHVVLARPRRTPRPCSGVRWPPPPHVRPLRRSRRRPDRRATLASVSERSTSACRS